MIPAVVINEKFTVQEMRRGFKKKIFIGFIVLFLFLLFFLSPDRGSNHELQELRANYSRLLKECDVKLTKLPVIYVITPTYARPVQKAELTRLSHTLRLVPFVHWILVEDSPKPTSLVGNLLKKTGLTHTILSVPTPKEWKLKEKDPNWMKPRGVLQRNEALQWIRQNVHPHEEAVLYFADDDNVYSLEIFEEMRWTKRVSVWPVGLVGGLRVERPYVDRVTGKVTGWNAAWRPERPYPVDMAGFAISSSLLLSKTDAKFSLTWERGYLESQMLQTLLSSRDELEPKADMCTKVYVWHTRTEAPNLREETKRKKYANYSDFLIEV